MDRYINILPSYDFLEVNSMSEDPEVRATDRGYWCDECKSWWSKGVPVHPHGFEEEEVNHLVKKWGLTDDRSKWEKREDAREAILEEAEQVDHPLHYNTCGMETIDVLEDQLSKDEFAGFLIGNAIKYTTRCRHKGNHTQDIEKAIWYLRKLSKHLDKC
jgi:hypothetical protein